MARMKTATAAARRWSAASYATCRRGLTHLARSRRAQLAAFLLAGVVLGAGLVAGLGDIAGGGSENGHRDSVHGVADPAQAQRNDGAEMDRHDGEHGQGEGTDG